MATASVTGTSFQVDELSGRGALYVGSSDPKLAAIEWAHGHPRFQGDLIVHSVTKPRIPGERSLQLLSIFQIDGPSRVQWIFGQVGG